MLLPQLDYSTYLSQLFWLAINFFVLYFFVRKVFIPNVKLRLKKRANMMKDLERQTAILQAEAENLHRELSELKIETENQRTAMRDKALAEVDRKYNQQQLQLTEEIKALRTANEAQLEQLMKSMQENQKKIIVEHARYIIENLTGQKPAENDLDAFIS